MPVDKKSPFKGDFLFLKRQIIDNTKKTGLGIFFKVKYFNGVDHEI